MLTGLGLQRSFSWLLLPRRVAGVSGTEAVEWAEGPITDMLLANTNQPSSLGPGGGKGMHRVGCGNTGRLANREA